MKNKKGFTLIELLATIVVLAILITTATAVVLPMIEKARKNALVSEAKEYMKAARTASIEDSLDNEGVIGITCHDISSLTGEYVKNDKGDYSGTVIIDNSEPGNSIEKISITNGKYYIVATNDVTKNNLTDTMPGDYISSCSHQQAASASEDTLAYKLLMNAGGSTMAENLSLIDERTSAVNFNEAVTDASNSGLFKDVDDFGTTYYYRGVINDNWVEFGDMYWRIVRINGDGTIRLLYSGLKNAANHTGTNASIKNSKNATATSYGDVTSYKVNNNDISGLTSSVIQTTYSNGRFGSMYANYMYNPKKVLATYPSYTLSSSKKLNAFPTYTAINDSKSDYYFFKNFNLSTDCFAGNDDDETGTCTLKCRSLGNDCITGNWNTIATTSGNYSTTAAGIYPATNPTQYVYTNQNKYTCWANGTPVVKNNSDGTTSVYISCPIVTEIIGTVKDKPTQAKVILHGLFAESLESSNANVKDSNMKKEIDLWYENTILNAKDSTNTHFLEEYIADEIFCNDRTSTLADSNYPMTSSGGNYVFAAYTRNATNKTPTFKCPNMSRDAFTLKTESVVSSVNPKNIGNKLLKYPVGLLTMDEAAFAGGKYNTQNKAYYLFIGYGTSTMTPYGFFPGSVVSNVWYIHNSSGGINGSSPASTLATRPIINLKADVLYSSGSGTEADPYKITLQNT